MTSTILSAPYVRASIPEDVWLTIFDILLDSPFFRPDYRPAVFYFHSFGFNPLKGERRRLRRVAGTLRLVCHAWQRALAVFGEERILIWELGASRHPPASPLEYVRFMHIEIGGTGDAVIQKGLANRVESRRSIASKPFRCTSLDSTVRVWMISNPSGRFTSLLCAIFS